MSTEAIVYDAVVRHVRQAPVVNRFRYRTRMWLVDLDDLPTVGRGLRWAARFEASDHVGDPCATLRANFDEAFRGSGSDVTGCRLVMLANARGAGHGFNPISLCWALDPSGAVRAVIAEVHNTYGGRHVYPLQRIDSEGEAVETGLAKRLYVSPFYGIDGRYTIRVSAPAERISVAVTLHPDVGPPFVATMGATRRAPESATRAALRTSLAAWRTSGLIRLQGVKLWARGVPIQPRPPLPAASVARSRNRTVTSGRGTQ